ncbi:MAG: hypothetical protein AAF443_04255 [Chlamydiota bacterium]
MSTILINAVVNFPWLNLIKIASCMQDKRNVDLNTQKVAYKSINPEQFSKNAKLLTDEKLKSRLNWVLEGKDLTVRLLSEQEIEDKRELQFVMGDKQLALLRQTATIYIREQFFNENETAAIFMAKTEVYNFSAENRVLYENCIPAVCKIAMVTLGIIGINMFALSGFFPYFLIFCAGNILSNTITKQVSKLEEQALEFAAKKSSNNDLKTMINFYQSEPIKNEAYSALAIKKIKNQITILNNYKVTLSDSGKSSHSAEDKQLSEL